MKRLNPEEVMSLGLVAKERGGHEAKEERNYNLIESEFKSESSNQDDNADGCYFYKKLRYKKKN